MFPFTNKLRLTGCILFVTAFAFHGGLASFANAHAVRFMIKAAIAGRRYDGAASIRCSIAEDNQHQYNHRRSERANARSVVRDAPGIPCR